MNPLPVRWLLPLTLPLIGAAQALAQSPFLGQYSGPVLIGFSGAVNQAPTSAGGLIFNVLSDGTVSEVGGDPLGAVDLSGAITWQQPNAFNFATGTISGGTLSSSSSTTSGGLTTTYSVSATVRSGSFAAGQTLTGRLIELGSENGYTDHLSVRYTNNGFIAVGRNGTVARSDDGVTWSRSAAPTARDLNAVAYGNGIYVAGGENGVLFTSPNATDWTQRTSPFGISPISSIVFGAGKFVMTADVGGGRASSTDGISWTTGAVFGNRTVFTGSKFIAFSNSGTSIWLSDDGISYPTTANPGVGSVTDVVFGNGVYLVAGTSGVARSTNLTAWTTTYTGNVALVGFGNGRYVARRVGSSGELVYSNDGTTWMLGNPIASTSVSSLAYGEGRFIFAGQDLVSSEDGISWGLLRKTPFGFDIVDYSTTPGLVLNKRLMTDKNGVRQAIDVNVFALSGPGFWAGPNGTFFVERTGLSGLLDMQTTADFHAIMTAGSAPSVTYVGGAGGVIRRVNVVDSPAPAATVIPIISPTSQTLRGAISSGTSNRIFVGDGGTIVRVDNPTAPNPGFVLENSGTTRNLRSADSVATKSSFQIPTRDIIVGENGTLLHRLSNAAPGSAWTSASTGVTETLVGTTYVSPNSGNNTNGRYVAVGENGTVITSTDLVTWSLEKPLRPPGKILRLRNFTNGNNAYVVGEFGFNAQLFPTTTGVYFANGALPNLPPYAPATIRSLTHGAGRFVAVGGDVSGASLNGRDWTASLIPSPANAVAFGNGRFVAVGGSFNNVPDLTRISRSADGIKWVTASAPSIDRTLHSVAFGSGRFVASGAQGVIVTSADGLTWSPPTNVLASDQEKILSLVHNGNTFVGVGGSSSNSRIISSTDGGLTFVSRSFPAVTAPLSAVAFGNGRFVAVGPNGYSLTSTDGVNFSRFQISAAQSSTGATPVFTAIAYANSVFIATTPDGQAFTSPDGGTWAQSFTGVSVGFTGTTVANGLAVFAGGGEIVGLAVEDKSPHLTAQPIDLNLIEGDTLSLIASVSGTGPFTYQWSRDGADLLNGGTTSGATSANLTISNIQPGSAGSYQLIVTNADGSRASRAATVTVAASPTFDFADWVATYPFAEGESDPLDDPDKDGVANLMEFVGGSDPLVGGTKFLPSGHIVPASQLGPDAVPGKNYFSFTARVRKIRPGITLTPQAGTTLMDLSAPGASDHVLEVEPASSDITDPAFEFITYYYDVAIEDSLARRVFMRLSVTLD